MSNCICNTHLPDMEMELIFHPDCPVHGTITTIESVRKRYQWKTKEGKVVFVDQMEDSHLLNLLQFTEERLDYFQRSLNAGYQVGKEAENACASLEKTRNVLMIEVGIRQLKPLPKRIK